jgi:hypothetical protein
MRTHGLGVVGLDLSTRGTAGVYLPPDWVPGDWDVPSFRIGYEAGKEDHTKHAERLHDIAVAAAQFVKAVRARHVYAEDAIPAMTGSKPLTELAGAVKAEVWRTCGIGVVPVNQSTARKYLMGKLPQKDRVLIVHQALKRLGCPWEDSDRGDALVIGSYGRTEHGLAGLLAYDAR